MAVEYVVMQISDATIQPAYTISISQTATEYPTVVGMYLCLAMNEERNLHILLYYKLEPPGHKCRSCPYHCGSANNRHKIHKDKLCGLDSELTPDS